MNWDSLHHITFRYCGPKCSRCFQRYLKDMKPRHPLERLCVRCWLAWLLCIPFHAWRIWRFGYTSPLPWPFNKLYRLLQR